MTVPSTARAEPSARHPAATGSHRRIVSFILFLLRDIGPRPPHRRVAGRNILAVSDGPCVTERWQVR
jgi:hypothetical protein